VIPVFSGGREPSSSLRLLPNGGGFLLQRRGRAQEVQRMTPEEDAVLRTTKEIIIKFIEAGKVSPTSFEKTFKDVNEVIRGSVRSGEAPA
jgi:hypothetical protein